MSNIMPDSFREIVWISKQGLRSGGDSRINPNLGKQSTGCSCIYFCMNQSATSDHQRSQKRYFCAAGC